MNTIESSALPIGDSACPAIDPAVLAELRRSLPDDVRQSLSPTQAGARSLGRTGIQEGQEILPGYFIEQKLGAGGFGEVFLCNAPGDIKKAVKVVFGSMDDERAERERKSLERIRDVRHPFLVGLERVEIVDSQLVIISELADRSLKDRFNECKSEHRQGLPREELIQYMRDAAEALDYLCEKHSLQHLDVKPENLLLLGEHIKVGDFGLLKDLRDTQVSLVGGVTPLYAPPEVLDGRPSPYSDQYSLAIVYQEMLTGQLPFNGRTAGQLASQHMHSAPDLNSLPFADRYAVGRALSKSPTRRFKTCREFVDAICNPPAKAAVQEAATEDVAGEVAGDEPSSFANWPLLKAQPVQTKALPPIPKLGDGTGPMVVVGVGGLGQQIVAEYRQRLERRFGVGARLPAIQLLTIDTDRASQGLAGGESSLEPEEMLAIPLRGSQDYRERKKSLQGWLSRRWLYNIPRSLQTEGIRPLGRLALVDHAKNVKSRLIAAIEKAIDPEAAALSNASTGIAFHAQPPRVFIVGSILGGTASGTIVDIGYMAQQCFDRLKLSGSVVGMLIHGDVASRENMDLANVNSLAALAELYHFSQGSYQYTSDGTLSPAPVGRSPFDSTYTVDVAVESQDGGAVDGIRRAATYLVGNTFGASAKFFDGVRKISDPREPSVRSFGVYRAGGDEQSTIVSPEILCDWLLEKWVATCHAALVYGGDKQDAFKPNDHMGDTARSLMGAMKFPSTTSPTVANQLDTCLNSTEPLIQRAWAQTSNEPLLHRVHCFWGKLDAILDADREAGGLLIKLRSLLASMSTTHRESRLRQIRETVFNPPVDGVPRLSDSIEMMFATVRELVAVQEACAERSSDFRDRQGEIRGLSENLKVTDDSICDAELVKLARQYCHARLHVAAEDALASECQFLTAEAIGTSEFFSRVQSAIESLRPRFGHASEKAKNLDPELLAAFEDRVHADILGRVASCWPMVLTDENNREGFSRALAQLAVDFVGQQALNQMTAFEQGHDENIDPIRSARPMLSTQPGAVRWLVTGPSPSAVEPIAARIEKQFGVRPTIAPSVDASITVYCEAEDLPLPNVVAKIVDGRFDLIEASQRVRSRQDIEWCC